MPETMRNTETKDAAKLRAQQEWMAEHAERQRASDAALRKLCTALLFWKFCPLRRCKRAASCAGDVNRCHDRFWPQIPEDIKVELRATIAAGAQGVPMHEAVALGCDARARYLAMQAAAESRPQHGPVGGASDAGAPASH